MRATGEMYLGVSLGFAYLVLVLLTLPMFAMVWTPVMGMKRDALGMKVFYLMHVGFAALVCGLLWLYIGVF